MATGGSEDGSIYWGDTGIRYLYLLEADAKGPVVPPNLDVPAGTIWLVDVPNTVAPIAAGSVTYGELDGYLHQRVPATGKPPALVSGKKYYLYALIDVGFALTRCLFTAP